MSCLGLNIKVYVCNFRFIKLVSLNQSSNCCKYADRWAKEILSDPVNFHRFLHCELRIANAQCSTIKLFQEKVIPILFFFFFFDHNENLFFLWFFPSKVRTFSACCIMYKENFYLSFPHQTCPSFNRKNWSNMLNDVKRNSHKFGSIYQPIVDFWFRFAETWWST